MSYPNLLLAQCQPQQVALLKEELAGWLAQVPGWSADPDSRLIAKRFSFENFYQVMAFVNAVAEVAHAQDHHPEMHVGFNACTLSYSTHSAQGLTANDFICAAQVSALPEATAE